MLKSEVQSYRGAAAAANLANNNKPPVPQLHNNKVPGGAYANHNPLEPQLRQPQIKASDGEYTVG